MLINFKEKQSSITLFLIGLAILALLQLGCIFLLRSYHLTLAKQYQELDTTSSLMEELSYSSDDLTKMIRLYTVTEDLQYKNHFEEIIKIRDGLSPRPLHYGTLRYWDLVINDQRPFPYGEVKALTTKMLENNLQINEFKLLKESEMLSSDLVGQEKEAIKLIEESQKATDDGEKSKLKERAIQLVFGENYMKEKARIMKPLNEFFFMVKKRLDDSVKHIESKINVLILATIVLSIMAGAFMFYIFFRSFKVLSEADQQNELLLQNILPVEIAQRLKKGETIADEYPQASVLFADIVKFTEKTTHLGPSEMLSLLGELFDEFDSLCEKYKVEKIKTIGDCYLAVSGIPSSHGHHAERLAEFALAIRQVTSMFSQVRGIPIEVRIGMALGKVIAGVMGHKKIIYDVWGDTVNVASRMESTGSPNEIQITEKMAFALDETFTLKERGEIDVKGKGIMKTYFILGKKNIHNKENIRT